MHLGEAPIIDPDLFIGRSTELETMEQILQPQDTLVQQRRLVLGGMGGIGKTQLAIAYAKRHCNSYDSTFWLNAMSEAVLQQGLRSVAQQVLETTKYQELDDQQTLLYVSRWFSDTRNKRWLLILDNYDEPKDFNILKYCPHGPHGCVVITTRLPDQVAGQQLAVRPLEDIEQSIQILATRSKRENTRTGKTFQGKAPFDRD